jgi:uncharacterized protein HemY
MYQGDGRTDEAASAVEEMLSRNPSAEGYSIAARLFTRLGQRRRAAELRAEALHAH